VNVGLTGGVIDSDVLAREAVAPHSAGLVAVVAEFGPAVLRPNGSLDRAKLAEIVFADPQRREALEGIIHPYVRSRSAEIARSASPGTVVVHDVPLLAERGPWGQYDVVVVVDAPVEVQLDRLVRLRGMTEADAMARIAAQATRDARLAIADYVIDNAGTLDELRCQVDDLWETLTGRAA
jgi:dephospho-CoA kinase